MAHLISTHSATYYMYIRFCHSRQSASVQLASREKQTLTQNNVHNQWTPTWHSMQTRIYINLFLTSIHRKLSTYFHIHKPLNLNVSQISLHTHCILCNWDEPPQPDNTRTSIISQLYQHVFSIRLNAVQLLPGNTHQTHLFLLH